eukprot:15454597-Alexandrium_andersonii.AAC.1
MDLDEEEEGGTYGPARTHRRNRTRGPGKPQWAKAVSDQRRVWSSTGKPKRRLQPPPPHPPLWPAPSVAHLRRSPPNSQCS